MKIRPLLGCVALLLATSSFSAAQLDPQQVSVDINFAFIASGTPMPAGKYHFQLPEQGPVVLTAAQGSKRVLFPVVTRLGRHDSDAEPELVFDKIGDKLYLSEVWSPGADGFLLLGTKEKHDHRILGGPRGQK